VNSAPPNHWNASAFRQRLLHSPPDEAALADEARRVAGLRLGRRERPSVLARSSPPSPETEAAADDPGLRERARLNFLNSYYRGTLFGAGRLAGLAQLAATPDEEGISPDLRRVRDDLRQEYRQITADLARYDRMRSFGSAGELGAAALGQLGGAVLSPESWLGLNAKGATWLWRSGKAALQQGAITGTADPIVQALNIRAGVQEQYDPARTGLAVGAGALLGGSLHSAAEALSHIGARPVASSEAGTSAISGPRDAASDRANLAARDQQAPSTWGAETGWRGLSPLNEIQLMRYNHAYRTLRELDPKNPQLSTLDTSVWFPQSWDIQGLNQEIARVHSRLPKDLLPKELRQLDVHHPFPLQFEEEFRAWGIEPEDYTMLVPVGWHRLKPGGLHTGPDHWNKQWNRYIMETGVLNDERAIKQLSSMMKQIPWLKP